MSLRTDARHLVVFAFVLIGTSLRPAWCIEPPVAPVSDEDRTPPAPGWKYLGQLQPRTAQEIAASPWSVGAETMDRDFTIYENWKAYLGPLGIKHARLQSGWAKTEKKPGGYDFAWLDAIVDDMRKQGVQPWISISYGNTIYPGGGGTGLGGGLPTGEGLAAWDKYVAALVEHYRERVHEWEIWNEPNLNRAKNSPEEYGEFLVRTAEIVRAKQPQAKIIAFGLAGASPQYVIAGLKVARDKNKLALIDEVSYHPYTNNPDSSYGGAVKELRNAVKEFSPQITLRQGENGCPSQKSGFGALTTHDWSETSQAKWALRRMLGDRGRDILSSYFSIVDMHYLRDGKLVMNYKGLLQTNPDKTVARPKPAYYAVQHLATMLDGDWQRILEFNSESNSGEPLSVFGYHHPKSRAQLAVLWENGHTPSDENARHERNVTFSGVKFTEPAYLDLRTGAVFQVPADAVKPGKDGVTITGLPVYDSPIIVGDQSAVRLRPAKP